MHHVRQPAQRPPLVERAAQPEERVLALEHDGAVEGAERPRQVVSREAEEELRDAGTAAGQVHLGQKAPQLEREGVGRLQLPGKADAEPDGVDARLAQPRRQHVAHVVVERIALGARVVCDLVGRGERERRAIAAEGQLERRVGGRDQAQRRLDGLDRALVVLSDEEALGILEHRARFGDAGRRRVGVAARAPQREVRAPRRVVERRASLELAQARARALGQGAERLWTQQAVVRFDVGVDRNHLDAVAAEEARQHGHRQVGRGRITRGRVDEGDLHTSPARELS